MSLRLCLQKAPMGTKISLPIPISHPVSVSSIIPMSDPSRVLRNLNLGDNMPVTRAQSQATQRERGRTNPLGRPTSTSSSERSRALRETQIQSINPFEPPLSETNLHFTIDRLQRERTGTDSYYAFRFRPVSVLIRDPDNGGLGSVVCTCEKFRRASDPCVHILVC